MTFFNIFSNSKLENQNKPKIIIDHREKNSLVPAELSKLGFPIEFQQLKVGDYIVNNTVIERKTISDLKSSIINKRIFDQLKQLENNQGILIIEGLENNNIYEGVIHGNAFRGFLLALATENKVPFIFSQNEKDTAKYISVLANKKTSSLSVRQSRILDTKQEQQQFILEGFPNIGPTKAKTLLKQFHTLKNIFNASESELEPILGKKTKDFMQLIEFS